MATSLEAPPRPPAPPQAIANILDAQPPHRAMCASSQRLRSAGEGLSTADVRVPKRTPHRTTYRMAPAGNTPKAARTHAATLTHSHARTLRKSSSLIAHAAEAAGVICDGESKSDRSAHTHPAHPSRIMVAHHVHGTDDLFLTVCMLHGPMSVTPCRWSKEVVSPLLLFCLCALSSARQFR